MGQKLYLECYSGISGDMTVAALSGLMKDRTSLFRVLDHMPVEGFSYELKQVKKSGIDAWDFLVKLDAQHENHDHDMAYLHGYSHTHDHEHHHEHDENCTCGCHDHDHHHHHHADEVFTSWGIETPNTYSAEDIEKILTALDSGEYGAILRAKGMVPAPDGTWVYYDYVPEEHDIRSGKPEVTGKICVIGSKLDEDKLAELFRK